MSREPELSIIIVNWNVGELLRECLLSLKGQAIAGSAYEVHVIDNASSDGSVEMVREAFPDVMLTANRENVGFARANNQLLDRCRGRFILLLNPDTEVPDEAVDRMLDLMRSLPGVGALGCRLLNTDGSFQRAAGGAFPSLVTVAWHYLFLNKILPARWGPRPLFLEDGASGTFDVDWVSGAAMMLRREALGDRIFDETFFMFGEDMELCDRIRRAGWRVLFTSEASVVHHHGASMDKQTSTEVLSSVLRGPRAFFAMSHRRISVWIYDLILLAGYLIRWSCFRVLALLRPGRGHGARAIASRHHALTAARGMLGH